MDTNVAAGPAPVEAAGLVQDAPGPERTVFPILLAISFSHLLNDLVQSLVPAIYPMLRDQYGLNFSQIGIITLTFYLTSSMFQPIVGTYTDRAPKPYSLAVGMGVSLCGLLLLSRADTYPLILCAAGLVGLGSAVFHPESSRVARMAAGGRFGLAQSVFQTGGNAGSAIGPLLAAAIIFPHGQSSVSWFSGVALLAVVVLTVVGRWYRRRVRTPRRGMAAKASPVGRRRVIATVAILMLLIFSKFFYMASLNSYYTLYLIDRFHVDIPTAQTYLFVFSGAVAAGTIAGGPIGDWIGRKYVIWGSILGVVPFTLLLPHASLFWTVVLTVPIGLILSSAFSSILVYAQELLPGRVGMISGLFFGFAFGMGGLGAAVLGRIADATSIEYVYELTAFLPLIGLLAVFLPDIEGQRRRQMAKLSGSVT